MSCTCPFFPSVTASSVFGNGRTTVNLPPFVLFAFHRYMSAHQFHKLFHDGKSQPEAVLRGGIAQPLERLKYPFLLFFADACTRILDFTCMANSVSSVSAIRLSVKGLDRIVAFLLSSLK